jgi:hypothetical protein
MSAEPIYIEYSEELRRALAKAKNLDMQERVREELAKEGVANVSVELAPDPTSEKGERDVFLLILAAGATAALVGGAVARVIDAVTKRKATEGVVTDLEVALDGKGNPVYDSDGNPVYNKKTKPATVPSSGKEKTSISAGKLIKIDFERG